MTKTIEERLEYLERQNKLQDKVNVDTVKVALSMFEKILILERRIKLLEE